MAKAKNKTTENQNSVADFIAGIPHEKRREDCSAIIELITAHTGLEAKMWGTSIVGFGRYDYKYESGHEGSAPLVGMASRANAITVYLPNFDGRAELLSKFGKHKTGKGCIYIQKLEDIDTDVLTTMVKHSIEHKKKQYPG